MSATSIDEGKLEAFMGQVVSDMGAIISAPLMVIGEKLGLYRAMAHAGPLTAAEVAERSGAAERYVREWLGNQAAGGYVTYDPDTDRYTLPDEHALALADEDSPFYILGVYRADRVAVRGRTEAARRVQERRGRGLARARPPPVPRHRALLPARATAAHLVDAWIPALDGVQEKLERGARVADVGCGHGASTIIMAEAFPNSEFFGFDYHAALDRAGARGGPGGRRGRPHHASTSPPPRTSRGGDYDLVCVFDCLHDMGDPVGAASHVREALADDGTWMIVEPFAGDSVAGEPQPRGAHLLRRLDGDLHAGLAGPGGRPRARRAGRRGAPHRGARRGRLHARAPRHRDALQPDPRSEGRRRMDTLERTVSEAAPPPTPRRPRPGTGRCSTASCSSARSSPRASAPTGMRRSRCSIPRPGQRVLDIGCGFGDATQQLAQLVGPGGEATGVDVSPRFIETAAREAAEAGGAQHGLPRPRRGSRRSRRALRPRLLALRDDVLRGARARAAQRPRRAEAGRAAGDGRVAAADRQRLAVPRPDDRGRDREPPRGLRRADLRAGPLLDGRRRHDQRDPDPRGLPRDRPAALRPADHDRAGRRAKRSTR